MKSFRSFTMVRQPVDRIWQTMRDRLVQVAAVMEDVQSVEVLERDEQANALILVNRWTARQRVPQMLRGITGGDTISWTDRAQWRDDDRICDWAIRPSIFAEYVSCDGTTLYESAMAGRGTRVTFSGSFELKPGFAGELAATFEPLVRSFTESIVSTMIPRSLASAIVAAGSLVADDKSPGRELGNQPTRCP